MKQSARRVFMMQVAVGGAALCGIGVAQAAPMVSETEPTALGLGYKADTTKVDNTKYAKHQATQKCVNCQLYQGAADSKAGLCPLFPGKQVAANGWCSAWVKKA
jgi:phage tail sheath protein FI